MVPPNQEEKHARENLIKWSKQMRQHISGRHVIDHQKATRILSDMKKIRNVCTKNNSNMQVWEKLEHQLSYIVDEHLSGVTINNMTLLYTNQVEVQQADAWDRGQLPQQAMNLGEGSQSTLDEQSTSYQNNNVSDQTPFLLYENLSSVAVDNINVQNTYQVIQQSERWDREQFPLQTTNSTAESQSILNEQCHSYYNNHFCSQKPLVPYENLSSVTTDDQSTNQVKVQQSEGRERRQSMNTAEGSQSILNEQYPSYFNNFNCSQKPLNQDFENLIQKTEISTSMQNVNNLCTTNYNNLAESETQCEFALLNIPNCDSIRQSIESMNIIDLAYSPDVIPDSQNISSITQPAILKKVTKGSQKHKMKCLSDKIAKLKISKPKKMRKIEEGPKPQYFSVKDSETSTLNNNSLKKLTESGSISVNPKSEESCANETFQEPIYFIVQNNTLATKPINACKKKVQFCAPFVSGSMSISVNQSQEVRSVDQSQEFGSENQTQELGSVNQTEEFGSDTQAQELSSVNPTQEFGSENQTEELGSVNQTEEFGSDTQAQELSSVNPTQEFGSENQTEELGSVNQTEEFGSETQAQEHSSVNPTEEFGSETQSQEFGSVTLTQEFSSENQMQELGSVNQMQEIHSASRSQKENLTSKSTPSTSKVLPASINGSFGWIKSIQRVYKVDPTEFTPLSMLPKSFMDDPLAHIPTEWEGDFDIW